MLVLARSYKPINKLLIRERKCSKLRELHQTPLSCKMQNKENILVFVLGFGANCEVVEPDWLKEKVFETLDKLYQKYEKEKK